MIEYAKVTNSKVSYFNGDYNNYTKRTGHPTHFMVQIQGSSRWYRVFKTPNTLLVKTKDNPFLAVKPEDTGYGKKFE